MPVYVGAASQSFELAFDGCDFQVGYKGVDDAALLPGAAQKKIDGYNLNHLDIPVISGVNDAMSYLLDGDVVCDLVERYDGSFFWQKGLKLRYPLR